MADKTINELPAASTVTPDSLFVLQQTNAAKKLTAQILENWLVSFADGHGGIQSIVKNSTSGLKDTYRITLSDTTTFDFVVTNGRSITGIAKTSTSGLVDTYRITYNDGTNSTFTVTNGAKGEKGNNAYVWIRYASQEPTDESHDFGILPDAWMGVYGGNLSTAPADWTAYQWYKIQGDQGETGNPATLQNVTTEFQIGDSGTIMPSGTWTQTVPTVPQGKYLWTRITIQFNTGAPIVIPIPVRFGMDGSGSVSSVNQVSPDSAGDVALNASEIPASDMISVQTHLDNVEQITKVATNINLLDNPWFTVNQSRGTFFVNNKPSLSNSLDRWNLGSSSSLEVLSNSIVITNNASGSGRPNNFQQRIGDSKKIVGRTVTLSVKLVEGNENAMAILRCGKQDGTYITEGCTVRLTSPGILSGTWTVSTPGAAIEVIDVVIRAGYQNDKVKIESMKLELGSVSTLYNDIAPDYAAELLKCQQYYTYIPQNMRFRASGVSANTLDFFVPIPNMRKTPTIDTNAFVVRSLANETISGFTFTTQFVDKQYGIVVRATKTAHGMTDAMLVATSKCFVDADL